jgi:hypothetical protein
MDTRRFTQGLGRFNDALLSGFYPVPEEISRDLDPRTVQALKRQAAMQMGLGMIAAGERGLGFGQGSNQALQQSQQGLGQGLGQAYVAKRSQREDERLRVLDERAQNRERMYDENYKQSRLDRLEDVAFRNRQLAEASRRADIDDKRQADMYGLTLAEFRQREKDRLEVERLSKDLAKLRLDGKGDDDFNVREIQAQLERYGINAYLATARDDDPFGFKAAAAAAAQGGAAAGPRKPLNSLAE